MFNTDVVLFGLWYHLQSKPLPCVQAFVEIIVESKKSNAHPALLCAVDIRKVRLQEGDLIAEAFLTLAANGFIDFQYMRRGKSMGAYVVNTSKFMPAYQAQVSRHLHPHQTTLRELANNVAARSVLLETT